MNGMDAVRTLPRSGGPAVVFTTTSREHAIEAFSLKAVHYLLKPLTRDGVKEALDRCLVSCSKNEEKFLMVKNNQGTIPVPTGNIIYIEVFNKISTIHTIRNDIQTYTSLDALFEYLDTNCFMKAQRSYIVNMKFIQTFYFDRLTLHNGIEIILSRKHRSVLKKQYQDYLFRLAREGEV